MGFMNRKPDDKPKRNSLKSASSGVSASLAHARLVLLYTVFLAAASLPAHAKPFLMECNYFKMQPASFVAAAHALLDSAQEMAIQDPNFQSVVQAGGNLTAAAYSSNLIGRVSDCNHGAGRRNIELVAGPFPVQGAPVANGVNGLTLIISALPNSHCEALKNSNHGRADDRSVVPRFEPPGGPPEQFGVCRAGISLLGNMNLPQPNTVYLFQPLKPPPPKQSACWRSTMPKGKVAKHFFDVNSSCQSDPTSATCQAALVKQHEAINKVAQLKASGQFKNVGVKDRASILHDLLIPTGNLQNFEDTRNYIYRTKPKNNVDMNFLKGEVATYDKIISNLRANPPSGQDPKTVAEKVADAVWKNLGVKPIPIRIVPARAGLGICGAAVITTSSEKYIEFQNCGFNLSGPSFYETVLEEAVHHWQTELSNQFCRGQIAESEPAYTMAWMFFMNEYFNTQGGYQSGATKTNFTNCILTIAYCGQPLEFHAKWVANYIRNRAFR